MTGSPKPTEAETLRQLTREAHEAIKDLRAAAKELRAERAAHAAFLEDACQRAGNDGADRVMKAAQLALDILQGEVDKVIGHQAALLGAADMTELTNAIVGQAASSLASQLLLAIDEEGKPEIRRREHIGEIFVTTDPANAPPGSIILDAR